ncbi:hypothetical protein BGZ63DRAFT_99729 [Mariannaea sp. PMI_226]|nr:hypothetical protein BGZ63DRAFT_99729 [Mariannaea sp. PMI_226]
MIKLDFTPSRPWRSSVLVIAWIARSRSSSYLTFNVLPWYVRSSSLMRTREIEQNQIFWYLQRLGGDISLRLVIRTVLKGSRRNRSNMVLKDAERTWRRDKSLGTHTTNITQTPIVMPRIIIYRLSCDYKRPPSA